MIYNKAILFILSVSIWGCNNIDKNIEEVTEVDQEKYRPQYHFTPPSKWMNDPNGMVYYEGEYHLFYQHYPDSNVWGPMHWGHAVSNDMVSWEHLPIALYPDTLGYIFSGSAVIDWNNTSGLGNDLHPPMVAIFTYHDPIGAEEGRIDYQTQGLAYSLDKGRTWTKYENNPVLKNPGIIDFRDPNVAWNEALQQWVMILAVKDHIEIYTSPNLIAWEKQSEFGQTIGGHGGVWECPDLFTLTDNNGVERWIMLLSINPGGPQGGSATQYFIGNFDGKTFTPMDSITRWVDHGADNYAGVTWSDIPKSDGRRLFMGWMSNWQYANVVPTYTWRSAMTLPRELILKNTDNGYLLQSKPVSEIAKYYKAQELTFDQGTLGLKEEASLVEINNIQSGDFEIFISNDLHESVTISISEETISFDRTQSGLVDFEKGFGAVHSFKNILSDVKKVQLYLDKASIEIFINDGELVMTEIVFPTHYYSLVRIDKIK